jgi:hypothetical protein
VSNTYDAEAVPTAISFRVDTAVMEAAKRVAFEEGLSLAGIARRALLNDLRQRQGASRRASKSEAA